MSIPLVVVETVINRLTKLNVLSRNVGEYFVQHEYLLNKNVDQSVQTLLNEFSNIVKQIIDHAQSVYKLSFTIDEIEEAMLSFLKEYDLDIMFGAEQLSIITKVVRDDRKVKYIVAKYIYETVLRDERTSQVLLKIAKGYSIASLLSYKDISGFKGSLQNVDIYLDAPIIYNLLGLNGEPNIQLTQELITAIASKNGRLRIFDIHYREVTNTLADAVEKLRTRSYDLSKSSRLIKTAVRENMSSSQIQLKANQLSEILEKYSIVVGTPTYDPKDKAFQIDQPKLQEDIKNLYNAKDGNVPWFVSNQIENDVEAISNIFRIRRSAIAHNLKSSKAILITNNEVVAFAAKKYEKNEWPYKSTIPVCLTDIFMATILWANYPEVGDAMNMKKLMCECYYITDLDNRILKKFYDDVAKAHKDNRISEEQYHLLNASNISYHLLEKKTLNDIGLYNSATTPREILEEIESKYQGQLKSEQAINNKIFNKIDKMAMFLGKCIFFLIAILIAGVTVTVKYYNPNQSGKFYLLFLTVAGLIAIFGILRWAEIIPTKKTIEERISSGLSKRIKAIVLK